MKLIDESGFLTAEGKEAIGRFKSEALHFIYAESTAPTEQELHLIGAVLSKTLGDIISTLRLAAIK